MTPKTALVTNVLDYVGPPTVDALLESGFRVMAHDTSFKSDAAREAYAADNPGVVPIKVQEPEQLIAEAWEMWGGIEALVSNDTYPAIHGPIEDADLGLLQETLDRVLIFPFALMKAAVPRLKLQRTGKVIMVTSCRTELPLPGGAIPDVARAAANALVKSLSLDLAAYNVPVNAIAPNYLYSEAYFPKAKFIDDPRGRDFIKQVVPAGRLGEPGEIGELVKYLANMKGSFHTGTIIKFAGGWPAAPQRPV